MGWDVFISHSSSDSLFAHEVCGVLEDAGLSCWIAPRNVGRRPWPVTIEAALTQSKVLLLVVSSNSVGSIEVERELFLAEKKPMLPLRLESVSIEGSFRFFLANCNWLDVRNGAVDSNLERDIITAAKTLVRSGHTTLPKSSGTGEKPPQQVPDPLAPATSLDAHKEAVASLALLGNNLVASAGWDTEILVHNIEDKTIVERFVGHTGTANYPCIVYSLAADVDNGRLFSAGSDGTIRQWNLGSSSPHKILTKQNTPIYTIALSDSGEYLVSGGADKQVTLWEVESGELLQTYAGHSGVIRAVAISPDGQYIFSGSNDGVRIWRATSSKSKLSSAAPGAVFSLALDSKSERVACGNMDGGVCILSTSKAEPLQSLDLHKDTVRSVSFSGRNSYLLSAGSDRVVRLTSLTQNGDSFVAEPLSVAITHAVSDEAKSRILTASADGRIVVWRSPA